LPGDGVVAAVRAEEKRKAKFSSGDEEAGLLKGGRGKGKQMKTRRRNKSIKVSRKKVIERTNRGCWVI
jgi:hypothetical protein